MGLGSSLSLNPCSTGSASVTLKMTEVTFSLSLSTPAWVPDTVLPKQDQVTPNTQESIWSATMQVLDGEREQSSNHQELASQIDCIAWELT